MASRLVALRTLRREFHGRQPARHLHLVPAAPAPRLRWWQRLDQALIGAADRLLDSPVFLGFMALAAMALFTASRLGWLA